MAASLITNVTSTLLTTIAQHGSGEGGEVGGGHGSSEGEETPYGIDFRFFASQYMDYIYFVCVVFSATVTLLDVKHHVTRFNYPKIQVFTVRVVMMVPVYGVLSFLSINFPKARFFLDTIRDTYEALVLYMFFMMLIAYGGGEGNLIKALNKKKYKGIHPTPLCCLPLFTLDQSFFLRCKRMVLQYAIWKPCASLIACLLEPFGYYRETDFGYDNAYLYVYIGYNITLSLSLYYLVLFEIETEKELRCYKAAMKFLCIKSLIFFAFWQSMAISMLISAGVIYVGEEHEAEHVTTVIMNGLICLELVPVSFLHHYAFSREKLGWEMAAQPVFNIETEEMTTRQALDLSLTFDGVLTDLLATVFYRKGKLLDAEEGADDDAAVDDDQDGGGGGRRGGGGGGRGARLSVAGEDVADEEGTIGFKRNAINDPTVEELVHFAFNNDRGIRPDGLIYVPNSSDDDLYDDHVEYADTDIIDPTFSVRIAREDGEDGGKGGGRHHHDAIINGKRVARGGVALENAISTTVGFTQLIQDQPATTSSHGASDTEESHDDAADGTNNNSSSRKRTKKNGDKTMMSNNVMDMFVLCSVCGRFDRELVKRKETYKCVECVGHKSIKELKNANRAVGGAITKAMTTVVDVSKNSVGISTEPQYTFKDERPMEKEEIH